LLKTKLSIFVSEKNFLTIFFICQQGDYLAKLILYSFGQTINFSVT